MVRTVVAWGRSSARKLLRVAAVFVLALAAPAAADVYPSRVITIVVPLPPGGATDTLTRTLADHMRMTLGQPIIIENVPGAGGTLGMARVVRAAPDGYTLGVGNWAAYVAASATYPVRYDVLNDLEGVAKLADTPLWMVARRSLPVQSLRRNCRVRKRRPHLRPFFSDRHRHPL